MKRRVRQGHTRWFLEQEYGPDGRIERVWILSMMVSGFNSTPWGRHVICRYAGEDCYFSLGEWAMLHRTRRAAWRAAMAMVQETDRRRNAEYAAAWSEG